MNKKPGNKQSETKDIPIDKISPGPIRNTEFTPEILNVIRKIQFVFREVFPDTFKEWVDSFKRDMYPIREIALWCWMADVYEETIEHFPAKLEYRKEIFKLLLSCTMEDDKSILSKAKTKYKHLSKEDIKLILKCRENPAQRVERFTSKEKRG